MNVFKHYSDTFLETIAEFYEFSAFSLFLSFDHVFGCITITIEIENTPFLLHLTKMFSKINTWQQVINLCQSWEIRLGMKWEFLFLDRKCWKTYLICIIKSWHFQIKQWSSQHLLIRLLLIYMPDFNSLSNIFAKIFIVLYRYMKNLGQPSCFCYK